MAGKRVVWILGSGFSVPLGGPLFKDLISTSTLRQLKVWREFNAVPAAGGHSSEACAEVICNLYTSGLGIQGGSSLWADAEQFLERLDIASREHSGFLATAVKEELRKIRKEEAARLGPDAQNPPLFDVTNHLKNNLSDLHREAIRFVAAACTAFLLRADENDSIATETEQWHPYRRWLEKLVGGNDSVITFNYDRALDILDAHGQRQEPKEVGLFHAGMHDDVGFETYGKTWVPIFHLHGHVGWRRSEDKKSIVRQEACSACAHVNPDHAVIGIPGNDKLMLPGGLLKHVWDRAIEVIKRANAIVVVGYRFPPTDNLAKHKILEAIGAGEVNARVHLVLGANNEHTPRVCALMEWVGKLRDSRALTVHPLYAEDFFTVFRREDLFNYLD